MKNTSWQTLFKGIVPEGSYHIERLSPLTQLAIFRIPEVIERFYSYHDCGLPEPCWNWRNAGTHYGTLYLGKLHIAAHRASWIIHAKEIIPSGKLICHKCDVRCCVNPYHLFVGTPSENMQDMVNKGRGNRGRKNTLTRAQAKKTRISEEPVQVLADRFGVGYGVVYAARYGYSWKHMREPRYWSLYR